MEVTAFNSLTNKYPFLSAVLFGEKSVRDENLKDFIRIDEKKLTKSQLSSTPSIRLSSSHYGEIKFNSIVETLTLVGKDGHFKRDAAYSKLLISDISSSGKEQIRKQTSGETLLECVKRHKLDTNLGFVIIRRVTVEILDNKPPEYGIIVYIFEVEDTSLFNQEDN